MAFVYWIKHTDHTDMFSEGYIGITSRTVEQRWKQHINSSNKSPVYKVHRAMAKYGKNITVVTIVEGSLEYCQEVEAKLRPTKDIGYNHAPGGASTTLGTRYSEDTCRKISEKAKGRIVSEETRKKLSEASANRPPVSEETRQKLSEINKGRKLSDETKAKLSKANTGKVRVFTEEHKKNLKASYVPRECTEETRDKIRAKATGRIKSKEAITKFSEAMSGRNLWENSAARKDLWAIALDFKSYVEEFPKMSARKIALKLGFNNCNPWKLVDKIRDGWNPNEDSDYLAWLENYQNNKG